MFDRRYIHDDGFMWIYHCIYLNQIWSPFHDCVSFFGVRVHVPIPCYESGDHVSQIFPHIFADLSKGRAAVGTAWDGFFRQFLPYTNVFFHIHCDMERFGGCIISDGLCVGGLLVRGQEVPCVLYSWFRPRYLHRKTLTRMLSRKRQTTVPAADGLQKQSPIVCPCQEAIQMEKPTSTQHLEGGMLVLRSGKFMSPSRRALLLRNAGSLPVLLWDQDRKSVV